MSFAYISNEDDGASSSIATVPICTSVETFFAWREKLEPVLVGIRALEIVRGKELCPTLPPSPTSTDFRLVESWKDRDAKAMSLIRRTTGGAYSGLLRHETSSTGMWELLTVLNDLTTPDHINTINRNLANLFLEEGGDMVKHLERFMEIVAEADAAGLSWGRVDREKCSKFFDTLPHELIGITREWRRLDKDEQTFL
ncbi:hypothetical protein CF326_g10040, partial [Tilletia indica]